MTLEVSNKVQENIETIFNRLGKAMSIVKFPE